jgi:hypothetical protein
MIFSLSLQSLRFFKRFCILIRSGVDRLSDFSYGDRDGAPRRESITGKGLTWAIGRSKVIIPIDPSTDIPNSVAIGSCYLSGSGVILDKLNKKRRGVEQPGSSSGS